MQVLELVSNSKQPSGLCEKERKKISVWGQTFLSSQARRGDPKGAKNLIFGALGVSSRALEPSRASSFFFGLPNPKPKIPSWKVKIFQSFFTSLNEF